MRLKRESYKVFISNKNKLIIKQGRNKIKISMGQFATFSNDIDRVFDSLAVESIKKGSEDLKEYPGECPFNFPR